MGLGRKQKPSMSVTLEQAKLVLLARALETSGDKSAKWTRADAESASLRAAHALGENAGAARMLVERARLVLSEAAKRGVSTTIGTKARFPLLLAPVFILAAFVLGALTDRIASPEHLVNLLSPPFWTVIVWNLAVYIVLFLCALGILGSSKDRFGLPLRSFLTSFVEKSAFSTFSFKKGYKSFFYSQWSSLAAPLVRMHVARVLHLAAIAFALGLIVSLLVRGFGTSYWAGWESTWLAENPSAVKKFLDCTYGLIPSMAGLPAMPDLAQVAQMRADNLPYLQSAPSAAPWLIRMMLLMTLVVIVPRLAFVLFDTWRIKRFRNHVCITLDDPYFEKILAQCAEDAALGQLLIVTSSVERPQRPQAIADIRKYWGLEADSSIFVMDFDDMQAPAPEISTDTPRKTVVLLWLDGMQTPEADTHGVVIDKLKAACEASQDSVFAALLDLSEFSEHFAQLPERIQERESLWNHFVKSRDARLFVMTSASQSQLEAVKSLRTWAAPKTAQTATAVIKPVSAEDKS